MLGKLSDKVLSLVLREERAGACIPEHGQLCYCRGGYRYLFNCNGICKKSSVKC
ncbi:MULTISPECIES: hypothetical protein [unclassified Streptomyces]|uniref:hypothetical protein n=1 Tax=unclassified Streptomyces TaxID=2593676 RepID=UPI00344C2994